jgi:hypothetical protein
MVTRYTHHTVHAVRPNGTCATGSGRVVADCCADQAVFRCLPGVTYNGFRLWGACLFTFVYAGGVPDESYVFTDRTYESLAKSEVSPLAVTDVLHSGHVARRHIGASLQIAGRDRTNTWLVVALVEDGDDQYLVAGARYLDHSEIAAIIRVRGEQQ